MAFENSEKLLKLSVEELEILLGEHLLREIIASKPATPEVKRNAGRSWFQQKLGDLRNYICGNEVIGEYLLGENQKDRNALLGVIIDILNPYFAGKVPVGTLAVLVMHYGLQQLCENCNPKDA